MHINELTLLIQRAGTMGIATAPTTSFQPIEPLPGGCQQPAQLSHQLSPASVREDVRRTVETCTNAEAKRDHLVD